MQVTKDTKISYLLFVTYKSPCTIIVYVQVIFQLPQKVTPIINVFCIQNTSCFMIHTILWIYSHSSQYAPSIWAFKMETIQANHRSTTCLITRLHWFQTNVNPFEPTSLLASFNVFHFYCYYALKNDSFLLIPIVPNLSIKLFMTFFFSLQSYFLFSVAH